MTLKEELEILRGEPIQVFNGDPMDIPCIETSDIEKLCKRPVVSVHMITYNHEPYIRRAIEGVMMQKTDFDFELVIGEDCSQDKTREICFEYQKKYPDKIRVLWWHENVSKLGGNGRRVSARCRGEFIAFCEGDDWWIDDAKLQKQVNVMRAHSGVGLCFCNALINHVDTSNKECWRDGARISSGKLSGHDFFRVEVFGAKNGRTWWWPFIVTSTTLIRSSKFSQAKSDYDIFNWNLRLGDLTVWLGVAALSDELYFMPDCVSQYNMTSTGATGRSNGRLYVDGMLVRMYYASKVMGLRLGNLPRPFAKFSYPALVNCCKRLSRQTQKELMDNVMFLSRPPLRAPIRFLAYKILEFGFVTPITATWIRRAFVYL